ncbi:MAG: SDR family oxidoreductase [Verrucomicrobia bacterium]|nr:SDR family oxidoreductase [Verrucomicrobiota bacterium]
MLDLKGKTALITGGGSGIGRSIAQKFAQQNAKVIIFELSEDHAAETLKDIRDAGGQAQAFACDVSNPDSVKTAVDGALSESERIDILINNAGIAHVGNAVDTSVEDFDRVYQTNVRGVYNCLHTILPHMVEAGGGVILNLASIVSLTGIPDRFAYSMSKGAVLTMTYSVATDFIGQNIRCNCICPGRVHTPFVDGFIAKNYPGKEKEMFKKLSEAQPIGRMAEPEEIANLSVYLCSDESAFVTGAAWPIDGGYMSVRL